MAAKGNGGNGTGTALAVQEGAASIMERVVVVGDLSKLAPVERVKYYHAVCESVGLNPLTQPFEYITLNNKLRLYARKDATDQLRRIYQVSIYQVEKETIDGVMVVTVHARTADGREDTDTGAVNIANLKGEPLANAIMKAITKAKRRVTLSICGLGWLDETEIETIPTAAAVQVSHETGEIVGEVAEPEPQPAPFFDPIAFYGLAPEQQRELAIVQEQVGQHVQIIREQPNLAPRQLEGRADANTMRGLYRAIKARGWERPESALDEVIQVTIFPESQGRNLNAAEAAGLRDWLNSADAPASIDIIWPESEIEAEKEGAGA